MNSYFLMVYYKFVFLVFFTHLYHKLNKLIKIVQNNCDYYSEHDCFPRFRTKNRRILYNTEFNQSLSFNQFNIPKNHSLWVSYHLDRTIYKLTVDYYYFFVCSPGLMLLIYIIYAGYQGDLLLSSSTRLRSFIEEIYYRTLRESVHLTKKQIASKKGLNSEDEIENFLIIKHTNIYNLTFNSNFKRVDVSSNFRNRETSFNMQRLTNDSFKWSEKVVDERGLTRQDMYDLAQLRIDLNLIESVVYKDYIFETKSASALKEATKECINFYLSMKGLK